MSEVLIFGNSSKIGKETPSSEREGAIHQLVGGGGIAIRDDMAH